MATLELTAADIEYAEMMMFNADPSIPDAEKYREQCDYCGNWKLLGAHC